MNKERKVGSNGIDACTIFYFLFLVKVVSENPFGGELNNW